MPEEMRDHKEFNGYQSACSCIHFYTVAMNHNEGARNMKLHENFFFICVCFYLELMIFIIASFQNISTSWPKLTATDMKKKET